MAVNPLATLFTQQVTRRSWKCAPGSSRCVVICFCSRASVARKPHAHEYINIPFCMSPLSCLPCVTSSADTSTVVEACGEQLARYFLASEANKYSRSCQWTRASHGLARLSGRKTTLRSYCVIAENLGRNFRLVHQLPYVVLHAIRTTKYNLRGECRGHRGNAFLRDEYAKWG
jgi:hypothetical protein